MPRKNGEPNRSGPNVDESQRTTVQLKLRLDPDIADSLRKLAGKDGVSAWVAEAVKRRIRRR